ncbi:MAG: hypothetical protein F4059_08305 [Gemmatimonadetes bacterium]|nr:hypothetical protein [Gemmatimonadota bacterium]
MFEVDGEIRRWRGRQERETSLSPRELDELEDHLRARVDLEMELNQVLAPERAFAIARRDLGKGPALAKEFARAGKPRWRRWLAAGWAMYLAALFLPVVQFPVWGDGQVYGSVTYGYLQLRHMLLSPTLAELPWILMNAAMLASVPALWGARFASRRWFRRALGSMGMCTLGMSAYIVAKPTLTLGPQIWSHLPLIEGFWVWSASYICVANALRLRAREWAPADAEPGTPVIVSD